MLSVLPVMLASVCTISDPATSTPTPTVTSVVPTPAYLALESPDRHLRAPDDRIRALLVYGFHRSATFADLVQQLNRSDVIVYIESMMTLPRETMGRITVVPLAGDARYLRMQIRADLPRREAIALIAHEMRHALEIAAEPEARDANGLIKLYERIGHASGGDHAYDTTEAQDVGRKALREIAS
jgi:hypothetical protein